jgi:nucleotide-binding universal stress UspA family protein
MKGNMMGPDKHHSGAQAVAGSARGVFLVASDGRAENDAALVMGDLFAGDRGTLRALAVVDEINFVPESQIFLTVEIGAARRSALQTRVHAQMLRTLGRIASLELLDGDPARIIAQVARSTGARLIVAGLGRHRVAERLFGTETVLRLMRVAETPVYAVANGTNRLASRIVAAVDFSETCVHAVRLAAVVGAPNATIYFAHVAPRDTALYRLDAAYKRNTLRELAKLEARLLLPASIRVEHVMLQGDPATEVLALAAKVDADLIATGSHGRGFVARLLIGSVATRIVRLSSCSVLAVPNEAAIAWLPRAEISNATTGTEANLVLSLESGTD